MQEPLPCCVDDCALTQPVGLTLDGHEALNEALEGLISPFVHYEQMPGGDRVVVVPLEVLQRQLLDLLPRANHLGV
jgi:hypothetical protein